MTSGRESRERGGPAHAGPPRLLLTRSLCRIIRHSGSGNRFENLLWKDIRGNDATLVACVVIWHRIGGAFVARFCPDQLRALRSDP